MEPDKKIQKLLKKFIKTLFDSELADEFKNLVNAIEYADFKKKVDKPMDLNTVAIKVKNKEYFSI